MYAFQMVTCEICGAEGALKFEAYSFGPFALAREAQTFLLCLTCARSERLWRTARVKPQGGLTRAELIDQLDQFFFTSGVFDICGRCHRQETGCCPPSCRVLGSNGCDQNNKQGKTVFCATFICGALLNAIAECNATIACRLKWLKNEVGPIEFRIYEMISRTPTSERASERILSLPKWYPQITELEDGASLKQGLLALADEVLEIRRRWKKEEAQELRPGATGTSEAENSF